MPRITFPVTFERTFRLSSYDPIHSVLLLRSDRSPDHSTRIDMMFRVVQELRLRKTLEHPTVDLLGDEDPRLAALGVTPEPYGFQFALSSRNFTDGYVIAGALYTSEDDLYPADPSTLDEGHPELESHVIRSGWFND